MTPLYDPYFSRLGLAAAKSYNFFNPNDGAVGDANVWPADQALKPDTDPLQRFNYGWDGTHFFEDELAGVRNLNLSSAFDAWTAMAYAAEAKSKGLRALSGVGGVFTVQGQLDLSTAFGSLGSQSNFSNSRADHSAPFNSDITQRYKYWNLLMQRFGLGPLNPVTPSSGAGGRP